MGRPLEALMNRVGVGVVVVGVAVVAGCGGSGAPSAAEQRAALDRWQGRADAACKRSNASIAKRGWPVSLVDLDRLTVRAIADVREASTEIQRMPAPKGSERRVAPFVRSLKDLEPVMERLSSNTEDFKTGTLEEFVPTLQSALSAVEKASKELGLRHCAANDEHVWVPDAIRAPVFAQQLAVLDRKITRRIKSIDDSAASPAEAARGLEKLGDLLSVYDRGLGRLKPPTWAEAEASRYIIALRRLAAAFDTAATELSEAAITPAEAAGFQAKLKRASRLERKRVKQLNKAIGAIPVLPGGGSGEEETPAGSDSQAA